MALADRIATVEADLATQRALVNEAVARLRGLEAELDALRAGVNSEGGLEDMSRTDAILTILRGSSGTKAPKEILDALRAAGRTDELRSVTATLDHLLKAGSVERPSRGRYLAG